MFLTYLKILLISPVEILQLVTIITGLLGSDNRDQFCSTGVTGRRLGFVEIVEFDCLH